MFKRHIAMVACVAALFATPALAAEPQTTNLELAREAVDLLNIDQAMDGIMDALTQVMIGGLENDPSFKPEWREPVIDAVKAEVKAHEAWYLEEMARIYADGYSETELRDLVTFLKSPSGQAFVENSKDFEKKGEAMGEELAARMQPGLIRRLTDIMTDKRRKPVA